MKVRVRAKEMEDQRGGENFSDVFIVWGTNLTSTIQHL